MMGTASASPKKDRLTIGPQVASLPHSGGRAAFRARGGACFSLRKTGACAGTGRRNRLPHLGALGQLSGVRV
jgi:hypothetical protein